MSPIAMGFGIGMILGIVLFFVLLAIGWIDKLLKWMDSLYK
jgi:hypothetical protein